MPKTDFYDDDFDVTGKDRLFGKDSEGKNKNYLIEKIIALIDNREASVNLDTLSFKYILDNFDFENIPAAYDNAVWVIRFHHDLNNKIITLPKGVILQYAGGSISNGTINFDDTTIDCVESPFLLNITFSGNLLNRLLQPVWFGAKNDDSTDNTSILNTLSNYLTNISIDGGILLLGAGKWLMADVFIRGKVKLLGKGDTTIIKPIANPTEGILNIINPFASISNLLIDGNNVADKGIRIYNNDGWKASITRCSFKNCNIYTLENEDCNIPEIINNWFEGPVYLNGADNCIVEQNVFQDFSGIFALKLEVTGVSKSAHSATIKNNWFETLSGSGFDTAIISNAYTVNISENHFNLPYDGISEAIQVGPDAVGTYIDNNNFQTIFNNQALTIKTGANKTYASDNRGLISNIHYTDLGTDTFISDGKLINSASIQYRPLGSSTTELLLDILNQKIQFGSDINNFVGKLNADISLSAKERLFLTALGTNMKFNVDGNEILNLDTDTSINTLQGNKLLLKEVGQQNAFEVDNVNEKISIGSVTSPIIAGSFIITNVYTILTIGTTDFTLIGASANTVGIVFTAAGVGAGTGTASTNNSYIGKNQADIELSANSRALITSHGTQIILKVLGTNGVIEAQNPISVKFYSTASLPDPTLYQEGTLVFNSTTKKLLRTDGVNWDIVGHTQILAQIDSVAADIATMVSDFNSLLAKMRTSGILET